MTVSNTLFRRERLSHKAVTCEGWEVVGLQTTRLRAEVDSSYSILDLCNVRDNQRARIATVVALHRTLQAENIHPRLSVALTINTYYKILMNIKLFSITLLQRLNNVQSTNTGSPNIKNVLYFTESTIAHVRRMITVTTE